MLVVPYDGCRKNQEKYRNEDVRGEEQVRHEPFFMEEPGAQKHVQGDKNDAGKKYSQKIRLIAQKIHAVPFIEVDDGGVREPPDLGDHEPDRYQKEQSAHSEEQKNGLFLEHTFLF